MITKTERSGFLLLGFIFICSLWLGFTKPAYFNDVFAAEDGTVEYGTAFMLLAISILCLYRLFTLGAHKSLYWKIGVFTAAALFFFGAGEEVSWGQRIFGIESSEFFLENNAQKETNLHNLVVGGKKINKVIFSQLLMIGMALYLIVLPFLYRKYKGIEQLADKFAIPVVRWHHTFSFLLATLIVAVIPPDRKWEVYELAFGVLFFLVFLNPLNQDVFRREGK